MRITVGGDPVSQWLRTVEQISDLLDKSLTTAMRMAAAFAIEEATKDMVQAGLERWTNALHIEGSDESAGALGDMRLFLCLDQPAAVYETGGEIHGNPLLWIPISGTDAAGIKASAFGGLASSKYPRANGGRPLLFSIADRQPKYFGIESVTVGKRLHLEDDVNVAMNNFRQYFVTTMTGSG